MIGITFLLFLPSTTTAQVTVIDTTKSNTIPAKKIIPHSPKKAALFSTAMPGLGQAYNKKYWKIPVIYAGFAGLAYSYSINQSKFTTYRNAYKYRIDSDPNTTDAYVGVYTDENLNTLQKYYHRYRDLSVIGMAALYVLNIVDASVDAHLFKFDVSDNLTMNIRPTLVNTSANTYTSGIGLKIKF